MLIVIMLIGWRCDCFRRDRPGRSGVSGWPGINHPVRRPIFGGHIFVSHTVLRPGSDTTPRSVRVLRQPIGITRPQRIVCLRRGVPGRCIHVGVRPVYRRDRFTIGSRPRFQSVGRRPIRGITHWLISPDRSTGGGRWRIVDRRGGEGLPVFRVKGSRRYISPGLVRAEVMRLDSGGFLPGTHRVGGHHVHSMTSNPGDNLG